MFEQALSRCAGYGITSILAIQDLNQLYRAYGREQTITTNASLRCVWPPAETHTAEWASRQLGISTITSEIRSTHGVTPHYNPRPLLTAYEILSLPKATRDGEGNIVEPGRMLILESGRRPVRATQLLYFRDPEMRRRSATRSAVGGPSAATVRPFLALARPLAAYARAACFVAALLVPALAAAALWPRAPALLFAPGTPISVPGMAMMPAPGVPGLARSAGAAADDVAGVVKGIGGAALGIPVQNSSDREVRDACAASGYQPPLVCGKYLPRKATP
jgi:hypothetical protein